MSEAALKQTQAAGGVEAEGRGGIRGPRNGGGRRRRRRRSPWLSLGPAHGTGLWGNRPLIGSENKPKPGDRGPLTAAQALAHLHSLDLIHGCLKPGSVLFKTPCSRSSANSMTATAAAAEGRERDYNRAYSRSSRAFVCLLDRCAAAAADAYGTNLRYGGGLPLTTHSVRWRELPYLAPEVLTEGRVGRPADVYSYGALLWQLVSGGVPPHAALHPAQLLVGQASGELPSLEWPPGADPLLRSIGEACLRREPHGRPTFDEIVVALRGGPGGGGLLLGAAALAPPAALPA